MKFIQLGSTTKDGVSHHDIYCFGLHVRDPENSEEPEENLGDYSKSFHKFRKHPLSPQNNGTGWYCLHTPKMSFKLEIIFEDKL